jgi:hypothetical protein
MRAVASECWTSTLTGCAGVADNGKGDLADTNKDIVRAVTLTAAGAEDDIYTVLLISEYLVV